LTARETVVEFWSSGISKKFVCPGNEITRKPPRGNDLDIGLETIEGKFKANLIIAFARAAV
jgi:hypothetical protein